MFWAKLTDTFVVHRTCYRSCSQNCAAGASPLILQYKLLTLPLGIPAQHNVIRLSAFSEDGVLQERTSFTLLEHGGEIQGRPFGIRDEAGRGIIFTTRSLEQSGLVRLRVQATTLSEHGHITYQSIFIIYISISAYPYWPGRQQGDTVELCWTVASYSKVMEIHWETDLVPTSKLGKSISAKLLWVLDHSPHKFPDTCSPLTCKLSRVLQHWHISLGGRHCITDTLVPDTCLPGLIYIFLYYMSKFI